MSSRKKAILKKPTLADVRRFAEAAQDAPQAHETAKASTGTTSTSRPAPTGRVSRSGNIPPGDFRLSANIDENLHLKLKVAAAKRRTTIGELLEWLIDEHLD